MAFDTLVMFFGVILTREKYNHLLDLRNLFLRNWFDNDNTSRFSHIFRRIDPRVKLDLLNEIVEQTLQNNDKPFIY